MKAKVIYLSNAKREFLEAVEYYETQSKGLGRRFEQDLKEKLLLIAAFPERYPKRKGNIRITVLKVFPFLIIYRYRRKENIVTITSVFQANRNPKNKYRR